MNQIYSEVRLKEHRKKNFENAIKDLKNKESYIMEKIEKIAEKHNKKQSDLYKIIANSTDENLKNLFIAEVLAKDPKKQNIYDNIFYEYMENNRRNIEKLPSSGSNALYLSNKELIKGKSNIPEDPEVQITKPLTFYEKINNEEYYYYHKYTKSKTGGGQGDKFIVLSNFVKIAKKYCENNQDNKKFVALVDGRYYDFDRKKKLKKITGNFLNKRIFIISSQEVLTTIK